jgi:hypothetical protein
MEPSKTYLMDDGDHKSFLERRNARIKELGYDVPEDFCPASMAEDALCKAEGALLKATSGLSPELHLLRTGGLYGKNREKAIKLICQLMGAAGY